MDSTITDIDQNQNPGFISLLNMVIIQVKTSTVPIYVRMVTNHIAKTL